MLGWLQFLGGQEIDKPIRFNNSELSKRIKIPANFDSLSTKQLRYQLPLTRNVAPPQIPLPVNDSTAAKLAEYKRMQKLFGSYADFQRKFLALELKNQMPDLGSYNAYADLFQIKNPVSGGGFGYSFNGPITYLYNRYNKEEVSRNRVNALRNSEPLRRRVSAKYNEKKIQEWTGLKDDRLTKFVIFCHFDEEYLVRVNEYELIDTVLKKLIEFKAKEDSANFQN